jgi:hypothetical protein
MVYFTRIGYTCKGSTKPARAYKYSIYGMESSQDGQGWSIHKMESAGHGGGGGRYTRWDDSNIGTDTQYKSREGPLGSRTNSYMEDHYPYAWRDVVDDIVTEEDFLDINDQDNCFH